MVDEFQDTGLRPMSAAEEDGRPHRNLMVVGDDDQTIYGFNGARNEFILEFDQTFRGQGGDAGYQLSIPLVDRRAGK